MKSTPFLLAALATTAACSSTPTRFWTIEPVSGIAPVAPMHRVAPVQVAAVHVPLAIDRLEVVQHDAANQVKVLDFDRWSAPPGDLIRRALTQDLVARLPAGSVVFPDAPPAPGTRSIIVDVLDLRPDANGYVAQLSWTLAGPDARPRNYTLRADAPPADVAGETAALGRITAELSDRIAADLAPAAR